MKLTLKPKVHSAITDLANNDGKSCAKFINDVLEAIADGKLIYPQVEGENNDSRETERS